MKLIRQSKIIGVLSNDFRLRSLQVKSVKGRRQKCKKSLRQQSWVEAAHEQYNAGRIVANKIQERAIKS